MFNNSINILTKEDIIKSHIDEFNASKAKKMMIKGHSYYIAENDINNRQMVRYESERPVADETKANNKLSHAFMHTLVDDKVNYLLQKPYTLMCDDTGYVELIEDILGTRFQKRLAQLGTEASNKGIAWLHPYIDEKGKFKIIRIPAEQCIPLWVDNDREELEAMIRYYELEVYEGKKKKTVTKIEYWTDETVDYYTIDGGKVILDAEMYFDGVEIHGHFKIDGGPASWGKTPFIYFKNNDFELPDLQFVKSLIDNYDLTRSDVANLLEEIKNVVYVLQGYGGEDLSTFVRDMAYSKAVKVEEDGGVTTLQSNIDINAAKEHYDTLREDIYVSGQGVDKNNDSLGSAPSGIALKFLYSGLDLKCNALEGWFRWGFEELIKYINIYLAITNQKVSDEPVEIIFNRDIAINETDSIENAGKSKGIISDKTIIANHPWVTNLEDELTQIEEEGSSSLDLDLVPDLPEEVGEEDGQ